MSAKNTPVHHYKAKNTSSNVNAIEEALIGIIQCQLAVVIGIFFNNHNLCTHISVKRQVQRSREVYFFFKTFTLSKIHITVGQDIKKNSTQNRINSHVISRFWCCELDRLLVMRSRLLQHQRHIHFFNILHTQTHTNSFAYTCTYTLALTYTLTVSSYK